MNDGNAIGDISLGHANTAYNPFTDYASKNQHDTLFFSSKKTTLTDKKAGVLVGKLYVFDPYFALYTDHGHYNTNHHYNMYKTPIMLNSTVNRVANIRHTMLLVEIIVKNQRHNRSKKRVVH